MRIDLVLCLPRDAATLPVVRHIVQCALVELGVLSASIDDVALALTEACTNVIKHSGVDDEYEVELTIANGVCEITVIDTGRGFDHATLNDRPGASVIGTTAEQGRGVALMAALVDRIRFESRPEEGTVVHLIKRLTLGQEGPLNSLMGAPRADGRDTGVSCPDRSRP